METLRRRGAAGSILGRWHPVPPSASVDSTPGLGTPSTRVPAASGGGVRSPTRRAARVVSAHSWPLPYGPGSRVVTTRRLQEVQAACCDQPAGGRAGAGRGGGAGAGTGPGRGRGGRGGRRDRAAGGEAGAGPETGREGHRGRREGGGATLPRSRHATPPAQRPTAGCPIPRCAHRERRTVPLRRGFGHVADAALGPSSPASCVHHS